MSGESNKKKNEGNQIQPAGEHVKSHLQGSNANTNAMSSTHSSTQKSHKNSQEYNATASCQMTASTTRPLSGQYTNQSNIVPSCQSSQTDDESKKGQSLSDDLQAGGKPSSSQRKDSLSKPPSRQNSNQTTDGASSQQKESSSRPPSRQNSNQSSKGASRQNSQTDDELKTDLSGNIRHGSSSDDFLAASGQYSKGKTGLEQASVQKLGEDKVTECQTNITPKQSKDCSSENTVYTDNITGTLHSGGQPVDNNTEILKNNEDNENEEADVWVGPDTDESGKMAYAGAGEYSQVTTHTAISDRDDSDKLGRSLHMSSKDKNDDSDKLGRSLHMNSKDKKDAQISLLRKEIKLAIIESAPGKDEIIINLNLDKYPVAVLQFLMREKLDELKKKIREVYKGCTIAEKNFFEYEIRLTTKSSIPTEKIGADIHAFLKEMAKSILVQEIPDVKLALEDCEVQLTQLIPTIDKKNVNFFYDYNDDTRSLRLIVVGNRPNADIDYRRIKEFLNLLEHEDESQQSQSVSLGACSTECFKMLGFFNLLKQHFPSLKFEIQERSGSIIINGEQKNTLSCQTAIQSYLTTICRDEMPLKSRFCELIEREEVVKFIYTNLFENNVIASFEVDVKKGKVIAFAKSREEAERANQFIAKCFREEQFYSDNPRLTALHSGEVIEFLDLNKGRIVEIYTDEHDSTIILGTTDVMRELKELIKKQLKAFKADLEGHSRLEYNGSDVKVKCRTFPNFVLYLMEDATFLELFSSELNKIKGVCIIKGDRDVPVAQMSVPEEEMNATSKLIDELIRRIPSFEVEFDGVFSAFFELQAVNQYISEQIKSQGLDCYWHTEKRNKLKEVVLVVVLKAKSSDIANKCGTIVKNCVQNKDLSFGVDEDLKKKVNRKIQKYLNKGIIFWDRDNTDHLIVCTSDIIEDFTKEVLETLEKSIKNTPVPSSPTPASRKSLDMSISNEKLDYLLNFMRQQVSEIESKYQVEISKSGDYKLLIKGFESSIPTAMVAVENLCEDIDVTCVAVPCRFAAAQSYMKDRKHMIDMAEKKKCFLKFEQSKLETVFHFCHWKKQFNLVVMKGRTTDIPVDVVMCPTNHALVPFLCCDDLLKYDNDMIKEAIQMGGENKMHSVGDYICVQASPVYSCMTIAYTVFQHTKSMKTTPNKEVMSLQPVLEKVLEDLDNAGVRSISIPIHVLDHGDVVKQLEHVWAAIRTAYHKFSSILQVYLCFTEDNFLPTVHRHILDNLPKGLLRLDLHSLVEVKSLEDKRSYIETKVKKGSLVHHKAEILVNTCDNKLDLSNGVVSASILQRAGPKIQTECREKYPNGINFDEVATTTAGDMKHCRAICHGALPSWTSAAMFSLQVMRIFIWQCLVAADGKTCKSIAFPALGTGKLKYPYQDVAETMFDVIEEYEAKNPGTQIRNADIVVFDKDAPAVEAFQRVEKMRKKIFQQSQVGKKDWKAIPEYILEDRYILPGTANEISIQVLPCLPNMLIGTQMEIRMDPNTQGHSYKVIEEDGTIKMEFPLMSRSVEQIVSDGLMCCENYKLSSVAFFVEGKKYPDIDSKVKKIRNKVFAEKEQPYLRLVQIYIMDKYSFEVFVQKAEDEKKKEVKNQEDKSFKEWMKKSVTALFSGPKENSSWRKKTYLENNERIVVRVVGTKSTEQVFKLRKELISYIKLGCDQLVLPGGASAKSQIDNTYQLWYRVDQSKKREERMLLSIDMCKRLDFAIENKEKKVNFEKGEGCWAFDMINRTCYEIKDQAKIYSFDNDGTCVSSADNRSIPEDEEPMADIKFRINPKLLKPEFNDRVVKTLNQMKLKYDKASLEITGSFHQMMSFNEEIKKKINLDSDAFFVVGNEKETYSGGYHKTKRAPQPSSDNVHEVKIDLVNLDYKLLQFFCPDCRIFEGKPKYVNGSLIRELQSGETEENLKEIVMSKLKHLYALTSSEIVMPVGLTIDDSKLHEVNRDLSSSFPDIFFCPSEDNRTLILKGSKYDVLNAAKTKCEIILGVKQIGKVGRRARVIDTETNYDNKGDAKPSSKSFSQSMKAGRSQYSQEFSSGPSTSQPSNEMTFKTPEGIVVKVYVGNILNLNVDAIVNAANENLMHGGGVADVISRAAGYKFQQESDEYIRRHGPISVGECCTTSAGNLQYKYVIHAVGPKWFDYPQDKRACANDLKRTIESCFYEADTLNLTSVALPAISSGIFGVPKEVCRSQYCQAVIDYSYKCGKTTFLQEIHFMDKDSNMISMIQSEFGQRLIMNQLSPSGVNAVSSSGGQGTAGDTAGRVSRSPSYDPDKYDDKKKDNPGSIATAEKSGKFQVEYKMEKGLKITIIEGDITQMNTDIIVCPQDILCKSRGGIARAIERVSNDWYMNAVRNITIKKCEVKKIKSSPSSLPFKGVLHAVSPLWDKNAVKENIKFEKELALTIRNIIQHCSDSHSVNSVAIPVLGVGIEGLQTPYITYAKAVCKEILRATQTSLFSLDEIKIVTHERSLASAVSDVFTSDGSFPKLTSFQRQRRRQNNNGNGSFSDNNEVTKKKKSATGDQSYENFESDKLGTTFKGGNVDDCVICMDTPTEPRKLQCGHVFCATCIGLQFKVKPVCPTCGAIQGIVTGDQPLGTMNVYTSSTSVAGYPKCGRIEIEYYIYSGHQGKDHPEPGKRFESIKRTAFLPDNERGRKIAKMLEVAFKRKLVFTIGHSRTTGKQGVVTWNDIHHKTNPNPGTQYGYPDETYLDRVEDELAVKGVTEKDI